MDRKLVRPKSVTAVAVTAADGNTKPSVAVKARLALKAVATHADKTTVDVTGQAAFVSKTAGIATVEGGTLTGVAAGTARVTASYGGVTSPELAVTVTAASGS